ncbi:MAG: ABC transporter permease [Spirochaetia bacterium]|nr:ABC transporter permease [Spirochaetia bacterium]MCF7953114.1 ABC transporter permease [Spirochaetales bacterium]
MRRKKLFTIARHEFHGITATRTFIIITILGPFLILAVSVIPSLLSSRMDNLQEGSVIGVVGSNPEVSAVLQAAFSDKGVIIEEGSSLEEMKERLLEEKNMQGILEIPENMLEAETFYYYSKTGTDVVISETIKSVLGNYTVSQRMSSAGFEPEEIKQLSSVPDMTVKKLSKSGDEEESQGIFSIMITAISFILLLYMSILLYGQMIGRSIVIEKTSKTVEILLSSARPHEIMFGKIFGIGAAGLLQYLIWISTGLLIVLFLGPQFDISLPASLNAVSLGFLLLFFLMAFSLYAGAYAALGSAAEDEQNLGQLAWPLIMFLVFPMVMMSPIVMNPDSVFSVILSYFPLTSPMVMFTRVLVNMPAVWELLLCFLILIISIILMIYGAARIFRVGILLTGNRHTFREIIKWMRYQ